MAQGLAKFVEVQGRARLELKISRAKGVGRKFQSQGNSKAIRRKKELKI
jgi:hypothetical protein